MKEITKEEMVDIICDEVKSARLNYLDVLLDEGTKSPVTAIYRAHYNALDRLAWKLGIDCLRDNK